MTASLNRTCVCGYGECFPCPTTADILPVISAMAEAGWRYDERGFALCPHCAKEGPPPIARPPRPQRDLFE